jgi:hypothetical protein
MMDPLDPRHGTYAGSIAHSTSKTPTCRPCKDAAATYRRKRRARLYLAQVTELEVNPIGSIRRIQALVRLGHSMRAIDEQMGWHWGTTSRFIVAGHKLTHRTTADRIAAVYERLCMIVPTGQYALRNRRLAERHGWPPPLAWTNIDDPTEHPRGLRELAHRPKTDIDPVIVDRLLAGTQVEHSTRAERDEAMRRWKAMGRSEKSLCDLHNWKESRYGRDAA